MAPDNRRQISLSEEAKDGLRSLIFEDDSGLPAQRTYAIVGTGALGGFYGARLQQAGLEVHFLLRSDYEYVHQHGLIVESIDGDFKLPHVNAYRDVGEMPRCDVVIVALKTTQNHCYHNFYHLLLKKMEWC